MPNCKRHGYYSQEAEDVGVGCPECYKEDDERFRADADFNALHCQLCGKQVPYEAGEQDGFFERYVITRQTGGPEDWEDEDHEEHFCEQCYKEKILPLFQKNGGG